MSPSTTPTTGSSLSTSDSFDIDASYDGLDVVGRNEPAAFALTPNESLKRSPRGCCPFFGEESAYDIVDMYDGLEVVGKGPRKFLLSPTSASRRSQRTGIFGSVGEWNFDINDSYAGLDILGQGPARFELSPKSAVAASPLPAAEEARLTFDIERMYAGLDLLLGTLSCAGAGGAAAMAAASAAAAGGGGAAAKRDEDARKAETELQNKLAARRQRNAANGERIWESKPQVSLADARPTDQIRRQR